MNLKTRHYLIILLGLATAALHFGAAFDRRLFPDGPDVLFSLNGLGYIGLLLAYFVPLGFLESRHRLVWTTFFVYTIATIVAWVILYVGLIVIRDGHPFLGVDAIYGIPAKLAELVLLYMLRRDKP